VAAQTVTAPVLTAALTTSVTAANPMAPAQGSVAMIGRTEGMRVVETAVISPLITADWMGLAPVTPPGTATLASSGVVGVEGAASVAAQLSAHTDAEPAEAKVLDVLFASSTKEDTRGAEQAAQVVMAGELPVVIAVPAAVAEPSAAVADGEQVLATSTATLVVPGTTLDRLFAEQGDEGTSTAFSGVRLVVPLLLAAGVCLAARRRTDGTTEPFVRLRTAHVTI
jgi:hypothetical protein